MQIVNLHIFIFIFFTIMFSFLGTSHVQEVKLITLLDPQVIVSQNTSIARSQKIFKEFFFFSSIPPSLGFTSYNKSYPLDFLVRILPFGQKKAILAHKKWHHLTEVVTNEQNLAFLCDLYLLLQVRGQDPVHYTDSSP